MDRELKLKLAFNSNIYINAKDEEKIDEVITSLNNSEFKGILPLLDKSVELSDGNTVSVMLKNDKVKILAIGNLESKIRNIAALYINGFIENDYLFKFDGHTYVIKFTDRGHIGLDEFLYIRVICPSQKIEMYGLIKKNNRDLKIYHIEDK